MIIRHAEPGDAAAFAGIYAQSVPTTVTFDTEPMSESEFREKILTVSEKYPFLAAAEGNRTIGYAYAHSFYIERPAYSKSVECSIYIDREFHRRGVGRKLYEALEKELQNAGIHSLYAVITAENTESRLFHEVCGFSLAGILHQAGFKDGRWLDVAFYEKQLPFETEKK